ncbi:histidine kinase [Neptunicella sp. SCSIO 80796]|uniref:histidine kinase n=1 Tax=Neptunicella plasticusilytica TaxID=3117012 RepID=UPI003A4DBAD1
MKLLGVVCLLLLVWLIGWLLPPMHKGMPELLPAEHYYLTDIDNPQFAFRQQDRSSWQQRNFRGMPLEPENLWIQMDFTFDTTPSQPQGIFVSMLGAFDAYWDGQLIGHNGVVGNDKLAEKPGLIDKVLLLDRHQSAAGRHTLSMKVSTFHNPDDLHFGGFWALVGDYDYLLQMNYKHVMPAMMMSGALLLVGLYCWLLYFSALKEMSYLYFGSLCFAVLLLIIAESWRGLWGYSYDWHVPRMQIVLALSCVTSLLLSSFFAYFFTLSTRVRYAWLATAVLIQLAILVLYHGYDTRSLYVFFVGISISAALCIYAALQGQKHSWLMLSGLILLAAPVSVSQFAYMDQYFFIAFAILIGLMLFWLNQTMRSKQQQLLKSQISANRLELELVKRHLQPHFIMNTLTAIEEWIEDSPAVAIKFIQALAEEFRCMADLASHSIIELRQELALCETHLTLMGYRTNTEFDLNTQQIYADSLIPPGVILTLLENAISHNHYQQGHFTFELKQTVDQQQNNLVFKAPVIPAPHKRAMNTGTGNKYIEARLTESYGQQWSMDSVIDDNQWVVTLKLPLTMTQHRVMA